VLVKLGQIRFNAIYTHEIKKKYKEKITVNGRGVRAEAYCEWNNINKGKSYRCNRPWRPIGL
jgi:hypothetical protein